MNLKLPYTLITGDERAGSAPHRRPPLQVRRRRVLARYPPIATFGALYVRAAILKSSLPSAAGGVRLEREYRQEGNGGWAGTINTASLRAVAPRLPSPAPTMAMKVAAARTGNRASEKLIDFGYRAVHETAMQSKTIIRASTAGT